MKMKIQVKNSAPPIDEIISRDQNGNIGIPGVDIKYEGAKTIQTEDTDLILSILRYQLNNFEEASDLSGDLDASITIKLTS